MIASAIVGFVWFVARMVPWLICAAIIQWIAPELSGGQGAGIIATVMCAYFVSDAVCEAERENG